MGGCDGLQGVIGRAPRTHQTRPAIDRDSDLQLGGLAAGAVAVEVEATLLMPKQVKQRPRKGDRDDKRQAVIAKAQRVDLLSWQKEGVVVPAQARH